ncbi:hypothetical protein H4696_009291 [Amycolatopsis lexingtonensis]|uniref:Uncharacterized protein n=1 Tax=Amycolatopsis lexingtonensis TaxID=218822 RepID=A0ABR9IG71_9PSEU|nr:hypothetical protein [Amycolatopsis lexingtonensis]MBE1502191.1 hypothetical protein [Amycolatopsis lexingtonensis]
MATSSSTGRALRPVVFLLYLNLLISIAFAVLTFLNKEAILDYQVLHWESTGQADPADHAGTRASLESVLWIRPVSVLVIAIVYVRLAARLKLGRRRTWVRVMLVTVLGLAGLVYLVVSAEFPDWMRAGQVVQAVVLLVLFLLLCSKGVRGYFSKEGRVPAKV